MGNEEVTEGQDTLHGAELPDGEADRTADFSPLVPGRLTQVKVIFQLGALLPYL